MGGTVVFEPVLPGFLTSLIGRDPFATVQTVYLDGRNVSARELERLSRLGSLEILNVARTQVTDASIPQIAGHTRLATIVLTQTEMTPAGIERLRSRLPRAMVYCTPSQSSSEPAGTH
ncbi:MAG: hypothetical protein KJZ78_01135 [Bryobacteraceae bacterium]|nr:hypothetical protein [Bryobacteraceae bacterium]